VRRLVVLAALAPATAFAEEGARPEELFLGEPAWLQERAELQLTAMPAWQRDHWDVGAAVEYGLTSRVQLSVEGTWTDGPNMDVLREVEVGARFAALRSERWALALGGNATASIASGTTELGLEPQVSLSFATRTVGANLSGSGAIAGDFQPAVAAAVFARLGRLIPLAEVALRDGDVLVRGGFALRLGSAELAAAVGFSEDLGASVHAALTWELALGDDDDDERTP
jgi:hypothetical protein